MGGVKDGSRVRAHRPPLPVPAGPLMQLYISQTERLMQCRRGRDVSVADRAAVQALLRGLATNEALCDEFARELRAQNLL